MTKKDIRDFDSQIRDWRNTAIDAIDWQAQGPLQAPDLQERLSSQTVYGWPAPDGTRREGWEVTYEVTSEGGGSTAIISEAYAMCADLTP